MTSVGFVCVGYYERYLRATLDMHDRLRKRFATCQTVFVANSDAALEGFNRAVADRDASYKVLRHDNSGLEFGAYQAGIDLLRGRGDPDWLIVANDTFATHSNFPRAYQDKVAHTSAQQTAHPAVIGRLDNLSRSYQLGNLRTHRWIQTNFFGLNRAAIDSLGGKVYWPELDDMVLNTEKQACFFDGNMDPVMREHLEIWLFRTRPGPHWYLSGPLTAANRAAMARKARAILQEKYLSAVLDAAGAEFIDLRALPFRTKLLRKVEDILFDLRKKHLG